MSTLNHEKKIPGVKAIQKPIAKELEIFEDTFSKLLKSRVPLLDKITHYIVKRKGKQVRPMFVFLAAKMLGEINESTYRAAALIELIHTATLVHDDVVDEAYERRGFFSINALWKNKIAVLVGDFLLSRSLMLSIDNGDFDQLRVISQVVKEMSEGELLQLEKTRKLNLDEDIYFEIIRQKTATLIAACCKVGAISTSAKETDWNTFWEIGENIGIAFQIKDDLFDFGSAEDIGKPTGIDIKEKKVTLPLLYALNNTDKSTKKDIISLIKNHKNQSKKLQKIIAFVHQSGGIQYAEQKMHAFKDKALEQLALYPDSEAKESIIALINYSVNRKK